MAAYADVFGAATFEYNPDGDKAQTKTGKQLGVAAVGSLGNVTLVRKIDDVTYKFKATETTFKNLSGLNGSALSISKPFGPITATGGLELGTTRSLNGTLKGKWTFEGKKSVELSALWSERTGATVLSLIAQPHPQLKLTNRLNTKNQVTTSIADIAVGKFVLSPAINWTNIDRGLSVSRKVQNGKLKASYNIDTQAAGVEYDFKPYKIAVTGKTSGKGAGRPKLTLVYDSSIELSQVKETFQRKKQAPGGKVPDVARHIPLDSKLKELDALYDPKLKKAEAKAYA